MRRLPPQKSTFRSRARRNSFSAAALERRTALYPETTDVKVHRFPARLATLVAFLSFVVLPVVTCSNEDQSQVEQKLDQLGKEAEQKLKEAEPQVREGIRDAQKAVGKGVEAAGELIQQGGEELQQEARDTTESSLPDTVTRDTATRR
jgi:hypothetical protein